MKRARYKKGDYRKAAQLFYHATGRQYRLYFTGSEKRHKRTETVLPYLAKRGELVVMAEEGEYVYIARRYCKGTGFIDLVEHGLMTTEILIRFWRADMQGLIMPSREFHGMGSVPDGGLMYPNSLLLWETTTHDNFLRHKVETKIALYDRHLPGIEGYFKRGAIVVFVIDAPPEQVKQLSVRYNDAYYFIDYETFKNVPVGQALTAPIYLMKGQRYPLRDVQPK